MSRRWPWGRIVSTVVGYGIAIAVVVHFLTHREPFDNGDLIRAALGILGLQVGLGKSATDMLDAFTRFVGTARSGWAKKTTEHPAWSTPTTRTGSSSAGLKVVVQDVADGRPAKPKRKRPPKGSSAHRSSAKGKPKRK